MIDHLDMTPDSMFWALWLVDNILLFRIRSIEKLSLCVKKNVAQYMGFWDCGMVEGVWVFSRSEDQGCVHRIWRGEFRLIGYLRVIPSIASQGLFKSYEAYISMG